MKEYTKKIVLLIVLLTIIKIVISSFIPTISIFSDEYIYAENAQNIHDSGSFESQGVAQKTYPPLYPLMLSISYLFKDMNIVYFIIKCINAIVSSLIVIPAFLLAKEFLEEKKAFYTALLIGILPASFSFAPYIMAENMFYPLFLTSFYFVFKSFKENVYWWDVGAGISIALLYLTKVLGLLLIPVVGIYFFYALWQKRFVQIPKKIIMALSFLFVITPWIIKKMALQESTNAISVVAGGYGREVFNIASPKFMLPFMTWTLYYTAFLALASGVILFVLSLKQLKEKKNESGKKFVVLSVITTIVTILIAANHNATIKTTYPSLFSWATGRLIGRYAEAVIPLIILCGMLFIAKKRKAQTYKKEIIFTSVLLVLGAQLIFFPLFPINGLSVVWIGVAKYILEFLLFAKTSATQVFSWTSLVVFTLLFSVLPPIVFILQKRKSITPEKIIALTAGFFIILNIMNYGLTYYNAKEGWYEKDQNQLGVWINKNLGQETFLIDERACTGKISKEDQGSLCNKNKETTIIGFWIRGPLIIGEVEEEAADYIISKQQMDLLLIKKQGEIYLYRAKGS